MSWAGPPRAVRVTELVACKRAGQPCLTEPLGSPVLPTARAKAAERSSFGRSSMAEHHGLGGIMRFLLTSAGIKNTIFTTRWSTCWENRLPSRAPFEFHPRYDRLEEVLAWHGG